MAHTEKTLSLGADWDLVIGADGGLAVLTGDEATIQNVCNEGRCFSGDLYFYSGHGVEWFDLQLGKRVQESVLTARLREAALYVPAVQSVKSIELSDLNSSNRTLRGTISIVTKDGKDGTASI